MATSAANADSNEIEQEFLESENETNSQDKLLGELFSCTIHLLWVMEFWDFPDSLSLFKNRNKGCKFLKKTVVLHWWGVLNDRVM